MSRSFIIGGGGATDPETVRDTIAAALVAGANVTITPNDGGDTITITSTTNAEDVQDYVAAMVDPGSGLTVVYDDAGNKLAIDATGTTTDYTVWINNPDPTGVIPADDAIRTAIATVTASVSSQVGSACYTLQLRFPPGDTLITDETVFDGLTIANSTNLRGLTIMGPGFLGKRAARILFHSTAGSTRDQTKGCLFRLINLRQTMIRDLSFSSNNANQTLFYLWCVVSSTNEPFAYPGGGGNNSYRFENIYLEGDWKTIFGADGGKTANQNSEIRFRDFTTSNNLTVADYMFRFGYPLYSSVFIYTNSSTPASGTWTFTYSGQTTSAIAYNASAADVQTAIAALATVGAGNVAVTGSASGGYMVKFVNTMLGCDTALASVTSAVSPVAFKCYRYTPQQCQFLNYHFEDNDFEYKQGNFMLLNMGGFVHFDGYHTLISGLNGGTGTTWFTMENIPSRADDSCHLYVRGARFELHSPNDKMCVCWWNDVNKFIGFEGIGIATPGIANVTRDAMEVWLFGSANTAQCHVYIASEDNPGYVRIETTGSGVGASGGTLHIARTRMKSQVTPKIEKYADATALAAGTAVVRVLGGARVRFTDSTGATGERITATTLGLAATSDLAFHV